MDLALPWLPTVELTVDGRDLEPAWSEAATLGEPVPYAPNADVDPVGHVETRALAEPRGLWVYAKVTDPEPALVRAGLGRRDSRWDDDQVGVLIDPEGDGQGVLLQGGGVCMSETAAVMGPEICLDLDGDGKAGYPDAG